MAVKWYLMIIVIIEERFHPDWNDGCL